MVMLIMALGGVLTGWRMSYSRRSIDSANRNGSKKPPGQHCLPSMPLPRNNLFNSDVECIYPILHVTDGVCHSRSVRDFSEPGCKLVYNIFDHGPLKYTTPDLVLLCWLISCHLQSAIWAMMKGPIVHISNQHASGNMRRRDPGRRGCQSSISFQCPVPPPR